MSFQHEDHFLLGLLEQSRQFYTHLIRKFIKLRVLFLDKLDKLAHLALEVVKTLTDKDSLLQLGEHIFYGRLCHWSWKCLFIGPLFRVRFLLATVGLLCAVAIAIILSLISRVYDLVTTISIVVLLIWGLRHVAHVSRVLIASRPYIFFFTPRHFHRKLKISLKLGRCDYFEAFGHFFKFFLLSATQTLFFVVQSLPIWTLLHCWANSTLWLRLIDKLKYSIIVLIDFLIAYKSIIQIVELVIKLVSFFLLFILFPGITNISCCLSCSFVGTFGQLTFLFALSLALLSGVGSSLMPTILLDGCQIAVQLQSSQHWLDQILEAMAITNTTGFIIFGPTNVLFI